MCMLYSGAFVSEAIQHVTKQVFFDSSFVPINTKVVNIQHNWESSNSKIPKFCFGNVKVLGAETLNKKAVRKSVDDLREMTDVQLQAAYARFGENNPLKSKMVMQFKAMLLKNLTGYIYKGNDMLLIKLMGFLGHTVKLVNGSFIRVDTIFVHRANDGNNNCWILGHCFQNTELVDVQLFGQIMKLTAVMMLVHSSEIVCTHYVHHWCMGWTKHASEVQVNNTYNGPLLCQVTSNGMKHNAHNPLFMVNLYE